jgi:hypothetical protein
VFRVAASDKLSRVMPDTTGIAAAPGQMQKSRRGGLTARLPAIPKLFQFLSGCKWSRFACGPFRRDQRINGAGTYAHRLENVGGKNCCPFPARVKHAVSLKNIR